ncbi:hypothetical protein ACLI4Y_07720 [Natrialbaceae archaeon A-CW3]
MNPDNRGKADTFLEGLCLYRELVFVVFVISLVMVVLSLISFVVVEPGSPTYVIVVLNLVGLGALLLASGVVLYLCRERVM